MLLPRPIATLELVTDCTEGMLQSCRSAILDGRENFRDAIERMLQRICDLGFDRARFWILNQDPHYLDGFVCFPRDKHAPGIATTRLVEHTDYYLRLAKQQRTPFYCTGKEGTQAPETARFRDPETPWIEVPLWARKEGHDVFVGKINLDNEPSLKSV
ncbi:MAG: hypothetical protein NTW28_22795, partial [Candidatus Solibacter sp.]|nr:hypothetical protein [Candidatus Solibacter sp.]